MAPTASPQPRACSILFKLHSPQGLSQASVTRITFAADLPAPDSSWPDLTCACQAQLISPGRVGKKKGVRPHCAATPSLPASWMENLHHDPFPGKGVLPLRRSAVMPLPSPEHVAPTAWAEQAVNCESSLLAHSFPRITG